MAGSFDVEQLLRLWTQPSPTAEQAVDRFRTLATDPAMVNETVLTARQLVDRAAVLQEALPIRNGGPGGGVARARDERARAPTIDAVTDAGDTVAVASRLSGRHVGPFPSSAGPVPPTGEWPSVRIIDILTLTDGRISGIVMVADELGTLSQVGAVQIAGAPVG
jgi:hypothetical protein